MAAAIGHRRSPRWLSASTGVILRYIDLGLADRKLPTIARLQAGGFVGTSLAVIPTFTNPNNMSIVTGVPPAVHGISGNYVLDRATGETRMITDASLMQCGTILAAMADAGVQVAAITAKGKLLKLFARDLRKSCSRPNVLTAPTSRTMASRL